MQRMTVVHPEAVCKILFLHSNFDCTLYELLHNTLKGQGKITPALPNHNEPYPVSDDVSADADEDNMEMHMDHWCDLLQQIINGCAVDVADVTQSHLRRCRPPLTLWALLEDPAQLSLWQRCSGIMVQSGSSSSLKGSGRMPSSISEQQIWLPQLVEQGIINGMAR